MPLTGALLITNPRRRRNIGGSSRKARAYKAFRRAAGKRVKGSGVRAGLRAKWLASALLSKRRARVKAGVKRGAAFKAILSSKEKKALKTNPRTKNLILYRLFKRSAPRGARTRAGWKAFLSARKGPFKKVGKAGNAYRVWASGVKRRKRSTAAYNLGSLKGLSRVAPGKIKALRAAKGFWPKSVAAVVGAIKGKKGRGKKAAVRANPFYLNRGRTRKNSGIPGLGMVTGLVSRIPVLGSPVAMALGTAAMAVLGSYVNDRFVQPAISAYIPSFVPDALSGTVTGSTVALAVYGGHKALGMAGIRLPAIVDNIVNTVAAASMLAGVISDLSNFAKGYGFGGLALQGTHGLAMQGLALQGTHGLAMQGLGDGMAYQIAGLAAQNYGDASMADAMLCGPDLDLGEGEAALSGERAWFGRFGLPAKRAAGPQRSESRHAGRPGHRWAWVIKMVGFENFSKIAALEPSRRLAVIQALRSQAVDSLPKLIQGASALPENIAQEAAAQNLGGYGALVFAGGY